MVYTDEDITQGKELYFEGEPIFCVETNGKVLFLARDVTDILGLTNPTHLTKGLDNRSKFEVVTVLGDYQAPQRYLFVDFIGLCSMVFRSRKSLVDRYDFVNWAKEIG